MVKSASTQQPTIREFTDLPDSTRKIRHTKAKKRVRRSEMTGNISSTNSPLPKIMPDVDETTMTQNTSLDGKKSSRVGLQESATTERIQSSSLSTSTVRGEVIQDLETSISSAGPEVSYTIPLLSVTVENSSLELDILLHTRHSTSQKSNSRLQVHILPDRKGGYFNEGVKVGVEERSLLLQGNSSLPGGLEHRTVEEFIRDIFIPKNVSSRQV